MAWQPTGGAGGFRDDEIRCGTQRTSMRQNLLINKTELGKVKRTTFNSNPPDTVYGASMPPDAEGARAVISSWSEHVPNPHAKPGPDFRAMNKAAAESGLTCSQQVRPYRAEHPAHLKTGAESVIQKPPKLPSDKDPAYTYGKPVAYRSSEDCRNFGPVEPKVKELVQGSFSSDWVDMNLARQEDFDVRKKYIKPASTAASEGHALGAMRTISNISSSLSVGSGGPGASQSPNGTTSGGWKMPKFEHKAKSKVTQYITGTPISQVEQIHH